MRILIRDAALTANHVKCYLGKSIFEDGTVLLRDDDVLPGAALPLRVPVRQIHLIHVYILYEGDREVER